MAKYRIPENFKPGFDLITELTQEQANIIVSVLNDSVSGTQPIELAKSVTEKIGKSIADLTKAFHSIFSLINLKAQVENPLDELVADIVNSYKEMRPELLQDKADSLNKYLTLFLSADGKVKHTIKSTLLAHEAEKNYIDSRIISDIRIVFDDDISKTDQCAVIVHQLKIAYQNANEIKEIFVTLDLKDLNKLREHINRALEKDKLIRNKTFSPSLTYIEIKK